MTCSQYDYIELVCLYHYPVKLVMNNGDIILGKALDTQRNSEIQHCIKLDCQIASGTELDSKECLVVLDDISSMQVCINNPHINYVEFD